MREILRFTEEAGCSADAADHRRGCVGPIFIKRKWCGAVDQGIKLQVAVFFVRKTLDRRVIANESAQRATRGGKEVDPTTFRRRMRHQPHAAAGTQVR